jgi:hypothetical protein
MTKHLGVAITETSLAVERRQDQIDEEARPDHLRDPHPRRGQRARHGRSGHRLQEPQARRARLPAHQIQRLGPAARLFTGWRNASGATCCSACWPPTSPGTSARPGRAHLHGGLLAHLATLTRNQVQFAGTPAEIPVLTEPTSEQRQAFDLIDAPIPLTLMKQPGQTPPGSAKPQPVAVSASKPAVTSD